VWGLFELLDAQGCIHSCTKVTGFLHRQPWHKKRTWKRESKRNPWWKIRSRISNSIWESKAAIRTT